VTKSYSRISADINSGIAKIREGAPDAMAGFGALSVAVYMGGGPSLMYAANAVHAFDEFQTEPVSRAATSAA